MSQQPKVLRTALGDHPITQAAAGPVVVEVWAPWCGPCRAMAPHLARVEAEYAGRVTLQKVNADASPEIVRALGIMGVPTVIALRDGREIGRRSGFQSVAELRELFDAAVAAAPGTRFAGPSQTDRVLRLVTGFALLVLAVYTGWPWMLVAAAAVVLFSAVHDRCPLWQSVRGRLFPSKTAPQTPAREKVT